AVSAIAAHLHGGVLAAGDRAADEKQMPLGIDLDDVRAPLRDAPGAHLAGHAHALENPCRVCARSDGARSADVVRAVGLGAAPEVMALDRSLEALADRHGGDLDPLARLEARDGDVVTDLRRLCLSPLAPLLLALLAARGTADLRVAEFDEGAHRAGA